jgi:type III restriction enzyme
LSQADATIDFEAVDSETYYIDLERVSENDYTPTFKKMNKLAVTNLNEKILSLPEESKIEAVNVRFCKLIGNMYPIPDLEVKRYVGRILEQMTTEQLKDCLERDYTYASKIKRKIEYLATIHKEKVFSDYLDIDKIIVKPSYELPEFITPSSNAPAVQKSLYLNENSMNGFEFKVINELANLENIVFWHKIIEKKGFKINGFLNHYPDFLLLTKSGKILLVESKGDNLDNSDSIRKLRLSQLWASKAGNNFRYFMVFDNNPIENAHKVDEATKIISQI